MIQGYQPEIVCPSCLSKQVGLTLDSKAKWKCKSCGFKFSSFDSAPPTFKPSPKQGETWWVRIGDNNTLSSQYIEKITDKIVVLKPYSISSRSSCFEIGYIKFVEEDLE